MTLPDLLRSKGVDPDEFLDRSQAISSYEWRGGFEPILGGQVPYLYITWAIDWSSQDLEGYTFWEALDYEWRNCSECERWFELEAVMGWLDPMEAELLSVNNERRG